MNNLKILKNEFNRIKGLGYVINNRPNNRDGGIGNTFEDHLGVYENNLKEADFLDFEIKSKRMFSSALVTLFSKSPTRPKGANAILKESFGEARDSDFPDLKKLYASIYGHRRSLVYNKFFMRLEADNASNLLRLVVDDLNGNRLSDECVWDYEQLMKASTKIHKLFIVFADEKKENNNQYYNYKQAIIYDGFNFDKFISAIENGDIQFDLRMGVHKSPKNYGKPHDHGSGFRVNKSKMRNLYDTYIELE